MNVEERAGSEITMPERIWSPRKTAEEFLEYRNDMVIDRFVKLHGVAPIEARAIFTETLKFLYACSCLPSNAPPSAIVDEMWHCFILFTRDYFEFCVEYAGRFLHHQPTDKPHERDGRDEFLAFVRGVFGQVDERYWYHYIRTESGTLRACDGNYCSEPSCGPQPNDVTAMMPFMR